MLHSKPPNVLFICVDDLKPLLGCYSVESIYSPSIDALASQGTSFLSAYCQAPLCAPSRTSLLTGLRPDTTKVYFNPFRVKNILRVNMPDIVTLPQHFKNHGYITCGMGKVFDGRTVDQKHDAVSWSEHPVQKLEVDSRGLGIRGYQNPELQRQITQAMQTSNGKHIPTPPVESCNGPDNIYYDGAMARTAVKKIKEYAKQPKPFFLAVGFFKPHLPFIAPKKYWDLYDRKSIELASNQLFPNNSSPQSNVFPNSGELRDYAGIPRTGLISQSQQRELIHGYAACVSYIDAQIGMLLETLRENQLTQNTIICLWADHGWHLGEHGHWGKSTLYEDATRIPLIIYTPRVGERTRTTSLVELLDLYPTLCDLAGLPQPKHLHGNSLLPLMHDPLAQVHEAVISQSSTVDSQMSNQLVGGKIDEQAPINSHMGWALRTEQYRYIEWRHTVLHGNTRFFDSAPVGIEFYDYESDTHENQNLANEISYANIIHHHQALMDRLLPHLPKRRCRE